SDLISLESGDTQVRRSPLRRYLDQLTDTKNRVVPMVLQDVTLFDWIRLWDWGKWKIRPRASPRGINYYPWYPSNSGSPGYSDYCRVKLMLHHPFEGWEDLLTVDGQAYGSYIDAFRACKRLHTHPEDFYTDPEADVSDSEDESDEDPAEDVQDDSPLADFETFARRRPYEDLICIDLLDGLGSRE